MKLTINGSRLDDLRKRKAEYDQKLSEFNSRKKEQSHKYQEDTQAVTDSIVDYVKNAIGSYYMNRLPLEITAEKCFARLLRLRVSCGYLSSINDDSLALKWSYEATFKYEENDHDDFSGLSSKGDLKTETGSWSGLQAVTPEQVQSLKDSVSVLEILNNIDWKQVFDVTLPAASDYFNKETLGDIPRSDEDFDKEIMQAQVNEIVGDTSKAIQVVPTESMGWRINRGTKIYAIILSESPAMYKIVTFPASWLTDNIKFAEVKNRVENQYTQNIRKSSFHPIDPVNIVDTGI